jgi:membrane protein CcdC involved in cytochrome C biogenesis
MRLRNFCFGLILSVIGLWSGLFDFAKEKVFLFRDFIVDCVASAFVLLKTKIPIVLGRVQIAMRDYYNRLKGFGVAVLSINGFTHKLAVNVNA